MFYLTILIGNVNAQQQGTAAAVGGTAANGGSSWGGIDATSQLSPSSDSISGGAVQEISRPVQFGLDLLQQVITTLCVCFCSDIVCYHLYIMLLYPRFFVVVLV